MTTPAANTRRLQLLQSLLRRFRLENIVVGVDVAELLLNCIIAVLCARRYMRSDLLRLADTVGADNKDSDSLAKIVGDAVSVEVKSDTTPGKSGENAKDLVTSADKIAQVVISKILEHLYTYRVAADDEYYVDSKGFVYHFEGLVDSDTCADKIPGGIVPYTFIGEEDTTGLTGKHDEGEEESEENKQMRQKVEAALKKCMEEYLPDFLRALGISDAITMPFSRPTVHQSEEATKRGAIGSIFTDEERKRFEGEMDAAMSSNPLYNTVERFEKEHLKNTDVTRLQMRHAVMLQAVCEKISEARRAQRQKLWRTIETAAGFGTEEVNSASTTENMHNTVPYLGCFASAVLDLRDKIREDAKEVKKTALGRLSTGDSLPLMWSVTPEKLQAIKDEEEKERARLLAAQACQETKPTIVTPVPDIFSASEAVVANIMLEFPLAVFAMSDSDELLDVFNSPKRLYPAEMKQMLLQTASYLNHCTINLNGDICNVVSDDEYDTAKWGSMNEGEGRVDRTKPWKDKTSAEMAQNPEEPVTEELKLPEEQRMESRLRRKRREAMIIHKKRQEQRFLIRRRIGVFVDPIDATAAFVKGVADAPMTLIGLTVDGVPIGGITDRIFVRDISTGTLPPKLATWCPSPTATPEHECCVENLTPDLSEQVDNPSQVLAKDVSDVVDSLLQNKAAKKAAKEEAEKETKKEEIETQKNESATKEEENKTESLLGLERKAFLPVPATTSHELDAKDGHPSYLYTAPLMSAAVPEYWLQLRRSAPESDLRSVSGDLLPKHSLSYVFNYPTPHPRHPCCGNPGRMGAISVRFAVVDGQLVDIEAVDKENKNMQAYYDYFMEVGQKKGPVATAQSEVQETVQQLASSSEPPKLQKTLSSTEAAVGQHFEGAVNAVDNSEVNTLNVPQEEKTGVNEVVEAKVSEVVTDATQKTKAELNAFKKDIELPTVNTDRVIDSAKDSCTALVDKSSALAEPVVDLEAAASRTFSQRVRLHLAISPTLNTNTLGDFTRALHPFMRHPLSGAGNKLMQVASGVCDISLSPPSQIKKWDVCAPHAFLRCFGGDIVDFNGRPIYYSTLPPERLRDAKSIHDLVAEKEPNHECGGVHHETAEGLTEQKDVEHKEQSQQTEVRRRTSFQAEIPIESVTPFTSHRSRSDSVCSETTTAARWDRADLPFGVIAARNDCILLIAAERLEPVNPLLKRHVESHIQIKEAEVIATETVANKQALQVVKKDKSTKCCFIM